MAWVCMVDTFLPQVPALKTPVVLTNPFKQGWCLKQFGISSFFWIG